MIDINTTTEWAYQHLAGKTVFNADIGKNIVFTKQGLKHAIRSKPNPVKIALTYAVKDLLPDAKLIKIESDKKDRPDIKRVLTLYNSWKYESVVYGVYLVIREGNNGHVYYDHFAIKKIASADTTPRPR